MDSGLGSDEDGRAGQQHRATKEQKQLHNRRLLSGCFIDAASLTDDGEEAAAVAAAEEERRRAERRQGALVFRTSIPQFSVLQMAEEGGRSFPVVPSSSCSEMGAGAGQFPKGLTAHEPSTPFNSIVQLDEKNETHKSSLGFYVDLNDVEPEANVPPSSSSSSTRKNIFSMVIDFEAPKKDMPTRLSSSLVARRKVKGEKKGSSSSSSSSQNGSKASVSSEEAARNSFSSSLCSSNNVEVVQGGSVEDGEVVKEDERGESVEVERVEEDQVGEVVEKEEEVKDEEEKKLPEKEEQVLSNDTQQFVKLADLERQTPRVDFSLAPKMSRSIPESSWVESPLLMSRSAGYRSAPRPIEPEPGELSDSFTTDDTSTSQPRRSVQRLGTDLLRMFLEEIGPDVTVEVEGRKLRAHKCILASRCQYFAAMLSGNWLEASGNVISLQGFTYESVYFALCHIYSGAAHVPDSISLVELASLADMLGLEGLKEVVEHALKQRHCHNFHRPCAGCSTGVVEVLPLAAAYGLDELYQKCLAWIRQHFAKVWPSRAFAGLPKELREKCYQQHIIHMVPDTVLDTTVACDKLLASIPSLRWAEPVIHLASQLSDACHSYMSQHFTSVLSSPSFLALETGLSWNISQAEHCLLVAANMLTPEQTCRSYSRCHRMLEQSWTPRFSQMLYKVKMQVEQRLISQAEKVSRCVGWSRMDPMLRLHIKEITRLPLDEPPTTRLPRATIARPKKQPSPAPPSVKQHQPALISSSDSSRNSSPGVNHRTRPRPPYGTAGSPSLRRSLLLAARTPQAVQTGPSAQQPKRSSTLTQPTRSSAAKSAPSKNLKQQAANKVTVERKQTQNVINKTQQVTSRPTSAKKNSPVTPLPPKNNAYKRVTPPVTRKAEVRAPSPRLTPKASKKIETSSPKKTASPKSPLKSSGKDALSPRKTEPVVMMKRSDTFLKEEPTVLQKT